MKTVSIHSKRVIEKFLRRNTFLHLYSIGDLDDFFWPYTTWYSLKNVQHKIAELVLFYSGTSLPILLALSGDPSDDLAYLLQSISHLLPEKFYADISGDKVSVFADNYHIQSHGLYYKMTLINKKQLNSFDISGVDRITLSDLPKLTALYKITGVGDWFAPSMLETGYYYGIRQGKEIVSSAGIHVYSHRYKVAALGNIATHPDSRGRGFATAVCTKLCRELLQTTDHIGLNVKADNVKAIELYKKLGFEAIAKYGEYTLSVKD